MNLWKRNAVVAAIVLFVCAAVYLNWSYSQSESASNLALPTGKTLGQAELVSSDTKILLTDTADKKNGEASDSLAEDALSEEEAGFAQDALGEEELSQTSAEDGYFAAARLNREEARCSALSILQETVNDPDAAAEAVSAASDSITAMASATLQESEIESLITAKGYTDCVAFVGDNSVSVVVACSEGELQAADVARVTDIVCGETSFPASSVKVIQAEG
ncbi:MAG: SpoIIIAH-like family protein [Oscillospiraceae bacterium]|nr:SpoIIIAH-like family protein [Oscillospiraceae bacterium]